MARVASRVIGILGFLIAFGEIAGTSRFQNYEIIASLFFGILALSLRLSGLNKPMHERVPAMTGVVRATNLTFIGVIYFVLVSLGVVSWAVALTSACR